MSEIEEESKPYKYARSFAATTTSRPVAEMDKEALQVYIGQILGTRGSKSKEKTSD